MSESTFKLVAIAVILFALVFVPTESIHYLTKTSLRYLPIFNIPMEFTIRMGLYIFQITFVSAILWFVHSKLFNNK